MDRDIADRLRVFTRGEFSIEIIRLALLRKQIDIYDPPENPAKITDSRAQGYIARHGTSSWELDALEPRILVQLIDDAVADVLDRDGWERAEQRQAAGIDQLESFAEQVRDDSRL